MSVRIAMYKLQFMQGDHDPVKRTFSEGQLSQHPFPFPPFTFSFFLSFKANHSPEICDPLGADLKDLYMFFGSYIEVAFCLGMTNSAALLSREEDSQSRSPPVSMATLFWAASTPHGGRQ